MIVKGIAASKGIAIAKTLIFKQSSLSIPSNKVEDTESEFNKLIQAFSQAKSDLSTIKNTLIEKSDEELSKIIEVQEHIIDDPIVLKDIQTLIISESLNAAKCYFQITEMYAKKLEQSSNQYMKERATDVRDVQQRVLSHLLGVNRTSLSDINEDVILVADELTPSVISQLNKKYIKGFITNRGGRTSHGAILARSLQIPAVVGLTNITKLVHDNDILIIDGETGTVILNPTKDELNSYEQKRKIEFDMDKTYKQFKTNQSLTKDHHLVEISANIGNPDDLSSVINNGADGVGLFRTEFIYSNRNSLPSENEQYEIYKSILLSMKDKKVIIRTLDIGGDKQIGYLPSTKNQNSKIELRGLQYCLQHSDIFKPQLRALLRSSIDGNLHIMFPMVTSIQELKQTKALIKECETELKNEGYPLSLYKLGIMVEIPSVAMHADRFAKEVDFFSIGTNDLIHQHFGIDRTNEQTSHLYQPLNPEILHLLNNVIVASHEAGIWTGVCGEMASDPMAIPILLGLGLEEFSMNPSSILPTRYLLSTLKLSDMKQVAKHVLSLQTTDEVKTYMTQVLKESKKEV